MTLLQAVILGVVQGITEFLPVSSSGHLVIIQHLFGLREPQIAFDVFLHLGTLVSILIFFYRDIIAIFTKEKNLILPLLLASIPTIIIGFSFKDFVERYFAMPKITGYMLLVTGFWLVTAEAYSRYACRRASRQGAKGVPGIFGSLLIGIAQGLAIMPGISRSGATISTGILSGLEKVSACRFAFLLAVPAIGGATLLKARQIGECFTAKETAQFTAGGLAAMIAGVLSIAIVIKMVRDSRLYIFGIYCFLAGLLIIIVV